MSEAQPSADEFNQNLRDIADRRFDQLYGDDPARYAQIYQRAQAIVGEITSDLGIETNDNEPAVATLTRATTKLLFLFEPQQPDPDTTDILDFSVARFVNRIFPNFDNLQAIADNADREANFLMVYQDDFAQEIGPAWAEMHPWEKIWFAGGMLAGRWPSLMQ